MVCLQEIKATDKTFPWDPVREAGYEASIHGQPTYNGVALVHRHHAADIETGFDDQARMIAATILGVRFINIYVPNGQTVGSSKHSYKLDWLDTLQAFVSAQLARYPHILVAGDFNIAPAAVDAAHSESWSESVLCDPLARQKLESLINLGLVDVLRKHHPGPGVYTWWDYRTDGFTWNDGLRIDHVLTTPLLASRTVHAWVDIVERGGDRPSDHAPVLVRFRPVAR